MNSNEDVALRRVEHRATELKNCVDALKVELSGRKITVKLKEQLSVFNDRYSSYDKALNIDQDYDQIMRFASAMATYGTAISQSNIPINSDDDVVKLISEQLRRNSEELREAIEDRVIEFDNDTDRPQSSIRNESLVVAGNNEGISIEARVAEMGRVINKVQTERIQELEKIKIDISTVSQQISSIGESAEKRVSDVNSTFEISLSTLSERTEKILADVKALFDSSKSELELKKKEVDSLIGTIAEGVMAGDYEKSSALERRTADYLRYGSLFCMAVIGIMVGYSFYETTINTFKWQNSVFRLVFSIILSIPAAYLAKESAKHRLQQYSHLQTSLDLKAITPYLASLPENERHRLKAEIAIKLFGTREFNQAPVDTYPLNVQDLLLALVNKVDSMASDVKKKEDSKA